jgi:parallel beta-helix repeat protein
MFAHIGVSRVSALLWVLVWSVVAGTCSAYLLYGTPHAKAATTCSGKHIYPPQNIANIAGSSPAGTTFCIHDGNYSISSGIQVQDNDRFIGVYSDTSRPSVSTTQAHYVFNTTSADYVRIEGLKISGAVGDNRCEPNCGRGIGGGGVNLTVVDVRITGNKNQGIGGVGAGLHVERSEIDHNGSWSFSGLDNPTSSVSAGIKSVKSMTVLNSHIHDNYWSGLWCDEQCTNFTVRNNIITGQGKAGIHFEISKGPAIISGNRIQGNGKLGSQVGHHAGLLIVSSSQVDAYNNTFGSNLAGYGVKIVKDGRYPGVNGVKIHDNIRNGDTLVGCTISGVNCYAN